MPDREHVEMAAADILVEGNLLGRRPSGVPAFAEVEQVGRDVLAPQCAGLLAISLGLGRLIADDQALLRHGFVVYDALYAWCQGARGERHSWNYAS